MIAKKFPKGPSLVRRNAVAIPIAALTTVLFCLVFNNASRSTTFSSSSRGYAFPALPQSRLAHNLVYWSPHKTGSTSMRIWLRRVSDAIEIHYYTAGFYPYSPFSNWEDRAVPPYTNCTILSGHIRSKPFSQRSIHEARLGAVITSTRDPYDTMASRYFHRTERKFTEEILSMTANRTKSSTSRRWFFYWQDLDACEQLRYYDAIQDCNYDSLEQRIQDIANRIDCVVDTNDPQPDLDALCKAMNLHECPAFLNGNNRVVSYQPIFDELHLTHAMERVVNVSIALRKALMPRRCRFLPSLSTPGMKPPNFPFRGCGAVNKDNRHIFDHRDPAARLLRAEVKRKRAA